MRKGYCQEHKVFGCLAHHSEMFAQKEKVSYKRYFVVFGFTMAAAAWYWYVILH